MKAADSWVSRILNDLRHFYRDPGRPDRRGTRHHSDILHDLTLFIAANVLCPFGAYIVDSVHATYFSHLVVSSTFGWWLVRLLLRRRARLRSLADSTSAMPTLLLVIFSSALLALVLTPPPESSVSIRKLCATAATAMVLGYALYGLIFYDQPIARLRRWLLQRSEVGEGHTLTFLVALPVLLLALTSAVLYVPSLIEARTFSSGASPETVMLSDGSTLILHTGTVVRMRNQSNAFELELVGGELYVRPSQRQRSVFRVQIDGVSVSTGQDAAARDFWVRRVDKTHFEALTEGELLLSSGSRRVAPEYDRLVLLRHNLLKVQTRPAGGYPRAIETRLSAPEIEQRLRWTRNACIGCFATREPLVCTTTSNT